MMPKLALGPIRRRARNADRSIITPMDLANMRQNGATRLSATCHGCGREAIINGDRFPDNKPVPDVGL